MKTFVIVEETWEGYNLSGPEANMPDEFPKAVKEVEAESKEDAGAGAMTIEEYKEYKKKLDDKYKENVKNYIEESSNG